MAFDEGGQMGLSFGFAYDNSGAVVERAIADVAAATDRLTISEQGLTRQFQQGQSASISSANNMRTYTQALQQASQTEQQFVQTSQQSISILNGAGTEANKGAQAYAQYTGSLANAGNELKKFGNGLNEQNTIQGNLAGTTQTTFEKVQQLGQGFGQAASSITGLIFSAHSLNRAQFLLHRTETQLEAARNRLDDQTRKLSKTTAQYGADSEQVAAVLADLQISQQKYSDLEERAGLVHESYDLQLVSFATTTGPLVISTISSISQGITSMTEVFGVSMTSVTGFIRSWGPLIGLGAGIGVFALGVVDALMKIKQANDDMANAIKKSDWDAVLKAKLEGLKTETENPFAIIVKAVESSFGNTEGGKSGFQLLDIKDKEKDFVQQLINFRDAVNDQMKSPEWSEAFDLPPSLTSDIKADYARINEIINGSAKNIGNGIALDPTYKANLLKEIDNLFKDINTKVAELSAERQRVTLSGTTAERMAWLGIPTDKEWSTFEQDYQGHLTNAEVIATSFLKRREQDNSLSWDTYIAKVSGATQEEIALAKETVDKVIAANKEKGDALVAVNDVIDASNKNTHSTETGLMNETIAKIKEVSSWSDNYAQTLQRQVTHWEDVNHLGISYNQTLQQQAYELGATNEQLNEYTITSSMSASKIDIMNNKLLGLTLELAHQRNELNLTTDVWKFQNQGMIDGTVAAGKFLTGLIQNKAQANAFRTELALLRPELGAIQTQYGLTNEEIMKFATLQNEGGDAAGYLADIVKDRLTTALNKSNEAAQIHNKTFEEMHSTFMELVDLVGEGGKEWSKAWKDLDKSFIPKGEKSFVKKFLEDYDKLKDESANMNKTISLMEQLRDSGFFKEGIGESWIKRLKKDINEMQETAEKLSPDGKDGPISILFTTLKNFVGESLYSGNFDLITKFLESVNKQVEEGTLAGDINAVSTALSNLMLLTAKPGETGSPEQGALEDFDEAARVSKEMGIGVLPDQLGAISTAITEKGGVTDSVSQAIDALTGTNGLTVASQDAQTGLANLAIQGSNSMAILAKNVATQVAFMSKLLLGLRLLMGAGGSGGGKGGLKNVDDVPGDTGGAFPWTNKDINLLPISLGGNNKKKGVDGSLGSVFDSISKGAQAAQTALANLAKQGTNSMSILEKGVAIHTKSLDTFLGKTIPIASQHSQTSLANLSNEGVKSLNALAHASSVDANGMKKNFSVGEVAAQHLQTGIANLSNEGVKSLKALAHASSTQMSGFVNNLHKGEDAVNDLKDAINSLKSKTVTVSVKVSGGTSSNDSSKNAKGGVYSFDTGGIVSADTGRINTVTEPTLFIYGDNPGNHETLAFIPHNDPVPTLRKLAKMFGDKGRGAIRGGGGGGDDDRGNDRGGVEVINLHMDGEKLMTWIRRKIGRDRQGR